MRDINWRYRLFKSPALQRATFLIATVAVISPANATIVLGGDIHTETDPLGHFLYYVGFTGTGTLTVNDNSSNTLQAAAGKDVFFKLGRHTGSQGTGLITGVGSALNVVGNNGSGSSSDPKGTNAMIGHDGIGVLTIQNGGQLSVTDSAPGTGSAAYSTESILVGGYRTGDGTLNVDGGKAKVESVSAFLGVGNRGGVGVVNVSNNGEVLVHETAAAGTTGAFASAHIGDKGEYLSPSTGYRGGQGTMTISSGNLKVKSDNNSANLDVGRTDTGTTGTLNVNGSSSTVDIEAADQAILQLGRNAGTTGNASITDGGSVTVSGGNRGRAFIGAAFANFGRPDGGTGNLTVSGTGSMLTVSQGDTSDTSKVVIGAPDSWGGGTSEGTVIVKDGGKIQADEVFVGIGGFLGGNGTIMGTIVSDGGFVAPGLSPGILTVDGNFSQTALSHLVMEVMGSNSGDYDVLNVLGDLDLTQGIIDLVIDPTFLQALLVDISLMPGLPDMFMAGGSRALDPNIIGSLSEGYSYVEIEWNAQGEAIAITAIPVPEPMTLSLMTLGLAGIGYRRYKKAA